MQSSARRWAAAGLALVGMLAFTAASGPADLIDPIPRAPASLSIPVSEVRQSGPTAAAELAAPGAISALPSGAIGAELLHDVPGVAIPASVPIAPEAIIPRTKTRTVLLEVTAYCSCKKCCGPGAHGVTSSGRRITYNAGHFVAADLKLFPYGTRLIVPGYNDGIPVEVIDRGGAIRGRHIDVFMPSHQQAVEWGKKKLQVLVLED